jgi:hypothetical protein
MTKDDIKLGVRIRHIESGLTTRIVAYSLVDKRVALESPTCIEQSFGQLADWELCNQAEAVNEI